ncbi:MAG: PAS domain-containing protein [Bacteriovoracaceae bacterium]|nr:PAS domain-containing protein [Bacteriovoracaceae bacterium]
MPKKSPIKKTAKKTKTTPAKTTRINKFPIVGIGASAGGLAAFEAFFDSMPEDSGMAFVLVAHLAPDHASILPELIQKKTKMKVEQVMGSMTVVPNHVYIIPPNKEMAISDGTLQLLNISMPRGVSLPIDVFLRSLAQDMGPWSIGIILSGTGTDGTLGIRAIKGEAGMVMSQDLESTKYSGMPQSAINTGLVDYTLPPQNMPAQLLSYVKHKNCKHKPLLSDGEQNAHNYMQKIFILLRSTTDHDFSLYKKNTINRRIERRMHVNQIYRIEDYLRFLQESKREINILFKELLIGVTNFFRDPEAFAILKGEHLSKLLASKPDDYQVRVWVAGCSSGEEAYSMAIIIHECMEAIGKQFSVQIFGTDLDEQAIQVAREGLYPGAISVDVSPERLKKYFVKENDHYRINKQIRAMVIFAQQNIIKDPPFTKLDFLSCRNMLIYFGQELQQKLIPVFQYSLKQNGLLFLGSSESLGHSANVFTSLDKKWKIFKCHLVDSLSHRAMNFKTPVHVASTPKKTSLGRTPLSNGLDINRLLKAILSNSNLQPCVVIDDQTNIIYIHGDVTKFISPAEGEITINIIDMANPGLKVALTDAINKVDTEQQAVYIKGLQTRGNYYNTNLNIKVKPLFESTTDYRGMILVLFEEISGTPSSTIQKSLTGTQIPIDNDIRKLEEELKYTKENLHTTIEELETSNEELQSTNEELQSTNEELETSKEELESLNEESTTVNTELQLRIDELVNANNDIRNLLDVTDIAIIFLDMELTIRRFTPRATDLFHLTNADVGRPIEHFATTLKSIKLHEYATNVLQNLMQQSIEVEDQEGRTYRMIVKAYRTFDNKIDGVVVTFRNVSEHKKVVQDFLDNESKWNGIFDSAPIGIIIEVDGLFTFLNPFACNLLGVASADEMVGKKLIDRIHHDYHQGFKKHQNKSIEEKHPLPELFTYRIASIKY